MHLHTWKDGRDVTPPVSARPRTAGSGSAAPATALGRSQGQPSLVWKTEEGPSGCGQPQPLGVGGHAAKRHNNLGLRRVDTLSPCPLLGEPNFSDKRALAGVKGTRTLRSGQHRHSTSGLTHLPPTGTSSINIAKMFLDCPQKSVKKISSLFFL